MTDKKHFLTNMYRVGGFSSTFCQKLCNAMLGSMNYHPVPDYHMHTPRCNHATGTVAEYAEAALRVGLKEIGMSDHSPMPVDYDRAWRMDRSELEAYLNEVSKTQVAFSGRLEIKTGLEADFHPGTESYVQEMIAAYSWDYVIGSVHYIGDWAFDNPDDLKRWDQWNIEDAYCAYYELVRASAESGMFDIIGHPDLIKKFGHKPASDSKRVLNAEEAMLTAIKKADVALEISSAGLRKPVAEIYPHTRIMARAAELHIPIAFGSDAHAPGEVGHAMDACLDMLETCGIHEVASFSGRVRSMQPIQQHE
ncbi:MAG: histidinol-phosphatase HisJ family protein [Mariprofundaceae bacterium]